MEAETVDKREELPSWVLAFGPFLVIGALITLGLVALRSYDFEAILVTDTLGALVIMTGIGFVAGILPVLVGMLWFPYVRRLDAKWVHAVLAFSAGILAFIAYEMADEAIGHATSVSTATVGPVHDVVGLSGPIITLTVAALAALATVAAMELGSRWQKARTASARGNGLLIAYLVAIGLGLHSVGEGLAIGAAFAGGDAGLVILFTVGFIIHNVTEGPAIIAAVARDRKTPPIRHFAAFGILAGGGVIVGGWIGTFATSSFLAALVFAVAFGAIAQVIWEMVGLVRYDAGDLFGRRIVVAFLVGATVIFFLEEIVVEGWLGV